MYLLDLDVFEKRAYMSEVLYHSIVLGQAANTIEAVLVARGKGDQLDNSGDALLANAISLLQSAARISVFMHSESTRGSRDQRRVRELRNAFMASVFDEVRVAPLHNRRVRHRLEHFDEYLDDEFATGPIGRGFVILVGPKGVVTVGPDDPPPLYLQHFDPDAGTFAVMGEEINLREVIRAGAYTNNVARRWLQTNE